MHWVCLLTQLILGPGLDYIRSQNIIKSPCGPSSVLSVLAAARAQYTHNSLSLIPIVNNSKLCYSRVITKTSH